MKQLIYSPLEQFALIQYIPIHFGGLYFSFTNSSLYMGLVVGLIILWFSFVTKNGGKLIPNRWQSIVEMIYEFVISLVEEQIARGATGTSGGKIYFPLIFTTFIFILFSNLIGMIPYAFTTTSHLMITFGLSISLFIGVTVIGITKNGLHFFSLFLPPGAPIALAPFLVAIELVSYSFRAISLGVRLFANMMAGHTLVKILAGFGFDMMQQGGLLALASIIPVSVIFALTGLEIAVAFLQAYVFTILLCIYLNDAINLH